VTIEDLTEEEKAKREAKLELWRKKEAQAQQDLRDQGALLLPYIEEHFKANANIRDLPVNHFPDQDKIDFITNLEIPEEGRDTKELTDILVNDILSYGMNGQHPRFLSYVMAGVSPYSLTCAILSDIYNFNGACHDFIPLGNIAEQNTIKWMGKCAGYPQDTCGGTFLSGGTMSNLTGNIAARDNKLEPEEWGIGTAYFSDQTHVSTSRNLHLIGFRPDQIVKIPTDDNFQIRLDLLREAIERDIAAGKKPFLLIGNLGTTNTGTIDPLDAMADIAEEFDMWFHVDGAYGGTTLASNKYRSLAKGIERTDSFAWDAHKWLLQTYSCSALIAKDRNKLYKAFAAHPEYLATLGEGDVINSWDMGPEFSRPIRGLKLWYTLQAMGTENISILVGKAWHMTKAAIEEFELIPEWELLSKPCCGTIAFRFVPEGWTDLEKINDLNSRISDRTIAEAYTHVAPTELKGKVCMRLCMINVNTTDEDVRSSIKFIDECARKELALS